MAKYLIKIGFDNGSPEDGPIIHTATEMIDAESEMDAENKVNNKYGYGRDDSYCGCSVKLATNEDIKQYEEEMAEAESEYQALIDAGIINPEEDADMWKQYEEDEKRRDHLLELADKVGFSKWMINQDDTVLIETEGMSDDQILKYMKGVA